MKILSFCGSLRRNSSNWFILNAAATYFRGHDWNFVDISKLPYFDPDNQFTENTPAAVQEMRALAKECDFIFISTPEYTHGIPGILKNGLEWLFCEDTQKKPVAVVIGSAQGEWVQKQLLEVLKTMDFSVNLDQFLMIKGARSKINSESIFLDSEARTAFENFCAQFQSLASK